MLKVDFHFHSHYSDGALSPSDLVQKAIEADLQMIALTDHDTTIGSAHLRKAAQHTAIQIIDGIELSVRWKKHDVHIVGLNLDILDPQFQLLIKQQQEARNIRAVKIAECLVAETGIIDLYHKACVVAGHEHLTRPHFAQVLVNEKIVPDLQSAFKRFLGRGKSAYIPTSWLNLEEAVKGIRAANGTSVIAHPLKYQLTQTKLRQLIENFKEAGGNTIEVVSGAITSPQKMFLAGLCERYQLFASTGSDYHSDQHSTVALGKQAALPSGCKPVWEQWPITYSHS